MVVSTFISNLVIVPSIWRAQCNTRTRSALPPVLAPCNFVSTAWTPRQHNWHPHILASGAQLYCYAPMKNKLLIGNFRGQRAGLPAYDEYKEWDWSKVPAWEQCPCRDHSRANALCHRGYKQLPLRPWSLARGTSLRNGEAPWHGNRRKNSKVQGVLHGKGFQEAHQMVKACPNTQWSLAWERG